MLPNGVVQTVGRNKVRSSVLDVTYSSVKSVSLIDMSKCGPCSKGYCTNCSTKKCTCEDKAHFLTVFKDKFTNGEYP